MRMKHGAPEPRITSARSGHGRSTAAAAIVVAVAVGLLVNAGGLAAAKETEWPELSHSVTLSLTSLDAVNITAKALFAPDLTFDVRNGSDLDSNGRVDASERTAFEQLIEARLADRPWIWNLTLDDVAFSAPTFEPYASPSIAGPVADETPVSASSEGMSALDGSPDAGASHTLRAELDAAVAARAPTVYLLLVLAPEGHHFTAGDGIDVGDECVASAITPGAWELSVEAAEGACTQAAIEAEQQAFEEQIAAEEEALNTPTPATPSPTPEPAAPTPTPMPSVTPTTTTVTGPASGTATSDTPGLALPLVFALAGALALAMRRRA
jgi:hypothetical protein